jgi:hypothetical protein
MLLAFKARKKGRCPTPVTGNPYKLASGHKKKGKEKLIEQILEHTEYATGTRQESRTRESEIAHD